MKTHYGSSLLYIKVKTVMSKQKNVNFLIILYIDNILKISSLSLSVVVYQSCNQNRGSDN